MLCGTDNIMQNNPHVQSEHGEYSSKHPDRALIHVFNNPSTMEGLLSWGYYLRNWNSLHPISTDKSQFCHFR